MSFMLVDDFASFPDGCSIHARRGGNGQFWRCDAWPANPSPGFTVGAAGGTRVLRCAAGAGRATLPLAGPLGTSTVMLSFRFCYPATDGAFPRISIGTGEPAQSQFTAKKDAWYRGWQVLEPNGSYNLYVALEGGSPSKVLAAGTLSRDDSVSISAGTAEFLLTDMRVDLASGKTPVAPASGGMTLTADLAIVRKDIQPARDAATALGEYLGKAFQTGAIVPVGQPQEGRVNLHVGDTGLPGVADALKTLARDEYLIFAATPTDLVLVGRDDLNVPPYNLNATIGELYETSTLSAVGRFLERFFGVRWFWPEWVAGMGTVIPPAVGSVVVPADLHMREAPAFAVRELAMEAASADTERYWPQGRWYRFNRLGVRDRIWHQHYWWWLVPRCRYLTRETDPCRGGPNPPDVPMLNEATIHLFAEVGGRRDKVPISAARADDGQWLCDCSGTSDVEVAECKCLPKPTGEQEDPFEPRPRAGGEVRDDQLCVSGVQGASPTLAEAMLDQIAFRQCVFPNSTCITIAPNDGYGHCECGPCRETGLTNRLFSFFNQVARDWAVRAPVKHASDGTAIPPWVSTYAYSSYTLPDVLKDASAAKEYLASNLFVFDTHNGFAYVPWNAESLNQSQERMRCWARATVPGGTGHLAAYTELYWVEEAMVPYLRNSPAAAHPDALARLFALLAYNRYAGSYVDVATLADRWLIARLFADTPPLPPRPDDGTPLPEAYVSLLAERAREALDDEYYPGLFGTAAIDVRDLQDAVREQIRNATGLATPGPDWKPYRVYAAFFKPVMDDPQVGSCVGRLQAYAGPCREAVQAVVHNWEFAKWTWLYLEAAEQVKIETPRPFNRSADATGKSEVEWCRQFVTAVDKRQELLEQAGTDPVLHAYALSPELAADEPNPLTLNRTKNGIHVTLDTVLATRVCRAVCAVADAAAYFCGPSALVARLLDVGDASPWASCANSAGLLWTTQFARVQTEGGAWRSFMVVDNDGTDTAWARLSLSDLDPQDSGWTLTRCVPRGETWTEVAIPRSARLKEPGVVVRFRARPGVNILSVNGANFAPYTRPVGANASMGFILNNALVRGPVGHCTHMAVPPSLSALKVRMFPFDDEQIQGGELGYFTVQTPGANDAEWRETSRSSPGDGANPYLEYVDHPVPTTLGTGTYRISGTVIDVDGMERVMLNGQGGEQILTLEVTAAVTAAVCAEVDEA